MAVGQPDIVEVLDELVHEWRDIARLRRAEGQADREIAEWLRKIMIAQMDDLLDLYNDLGGSDRAGSSDG